MRVLIFGASGMLGHKLYQTLQGHFDVMATVRGDADRLSGLDIFTPGSVIGGVDAADTDSIDRAIRSARPDCVINSIGVIKQVAEADDVAVTLTANSVFPHRLVKFAERDGFRLITISTDCVFAGTQGGYTEMDVPDARDLYGLSKFLGEIDQPNTLTLRTSMIGRELGTVHGLVEWFLSNRGGRVKGFAGAVYSGFPTLILSELIREIITNHLALSGVYHVSSDAITKYDLLVLLNRFYRAGVTVERDEEFRVDRSLNSERFRSITGFRPAAWESMIESMAADATPYGRFQANQANK